MKVEINIEPSQLRETMQEIFAELDKEQKRDLAKQILNKWLDEPLIIEDEYLEKEAMIGLVLNWDSISRWTRDEYLKQHTKEDLTVELAKKYFKNEWYDQRHKQFTSKEQMVKSISDEAKEYYKSEVKKAVLEDPQLKRVMEWARDEMKKQLPLMVMESMTRYFYDNWSAINPMYSAVDNIKQRFDNMEKVYKLNNPSYYDNMLNISLPPFGQKPPSI